MKAKQQIHRIFGGSADVGQVLGVGRGTLGSGLAGENLSWFDMWEMFLMTARMRRNKEQHAGWFNLFQTRHENRILGC